MLRQADAEPHVTGGPQLLSVFMLVSGRVECKRLTRPQALIRAKPDRRPVQSGGVPQDVDGSLFTSSRNPIKL